MENTRVNSNKFLKIIRTIKRMNFLEQITLLVCLMTLFFGLFLVQSAVRNLFFADSTLSQECNLLDNYKQEALTENVNDFYNMSTELDDYLTVYGSILSEYNYHVLNLSEIDNNNKITGFQFNKKAMISFKILKRHKKYGVNNSIYLTDVEYLSNDNNNYKIHHSHVIMTTNDIYYLEGQYKDIIYGLYTKKIHADYMKMLSKNGDLSEEGQKEAYQNFNLLNSSTQFGKK